MGMSVLKEAGSYKMRILCVKCANQPLEKK